MKTKTLVWTGASLGYVLALAALVISCSRAPVVQPTEQAGRSAGHPKKAGPTLSGNGAAELAAKLANDECERLYKRRPFAAGQQRAVLREGRYHWGGLDQGGPGGYSALVVFNADGSNPQVEVYFSTDLLSPARLRSDSPTEVPKR